MRCARMCCHPVVMWDCRHDPMKFVPRIPIFNVRRRIRHAIEVLQAGPMLFGSIKTPG